DLAASSFGGARSGLGRIRTFGTEVAESAAYARLSDLLDYDEHLAVLDLRLQLGQDGRVRGLELLAARENERNRYYRSPLGRLWTRLRLALRGYRVAQAEALARALDHVFDGLETAVIALLQLQPDMEFYLGGLGLSDLAAQHELAVCLPEFGGTSRE